MSWYASCLLLFIGLYPHFEAKQSIGNYATEANRLSRINA